MLMRTLLMERVIGPLREGGAGGQFPGQIGGKGWRQGRSGGRKGVELCRAGRIRIRMVIVFHSLDLFAGAKKTRRLGQGIVPLKWLRWMRPNSFIFPWILTKTG